MTTEGHVDSTWVFDVDGCLIDALTGTSVRPGAQALLSHLRQQQRHVVLWSAGGDDYAKRRAEALGLSDFVDGFQGKNERGADGRYLTDHFLGGHLGAVFVDDRPEDLPMDAVFVAVSPYLGENPHDRGLQVAGERAGITPRQLFG